MGLSNQANLVWIVGHSGVEGNVRADELARLGSAATVYGSSCEGSEGLVPHRWITYNGGLNTKHFLPEPIAKWSKEL